MLIDKQIVDDFIKTLYKNKFELFHKLINFELRF